MMARGKRQRRKPSEVAKHQRKIAMLYLEGWSQDAIADELEISQATVSRDLGVIQKGWQESAILDLDKIKQRELQKIDEIEREYLAAWRRSKESYRKTTVKGRGRGQTDKPELLERTTITEQRVGDSRYLDGVLKCIERRCKLLGIDAPQEMKVGHSGGIEINDERVRLAIERFERP